MRQVSVLPEEEELRAFLEEGLVRKLRAMAAIERRRRRRWITVSVALGLILWPTALAYVLGSEAEGAAALKEAVWPLGIWLGGTAVSGWWWLVKKRRPMTYGHDIVAPLIRYLHPRLEYRQGRGLPAEYLERLPLLGGEAGRRTVEQEGGAAWGDLKFAKMGIGVVRVAGEDVAEELRAEVGAKRVRGLLLVSAVEGGEEAGAWEVGRWREMKGRLSALGELAGLEEAWVGVGTEVISVFVPQYLPFEEPHWTEFEDAGRLERLSALFVAFLAESTRLHRGE